MTGDASRRDGERHSLAPRSLLGIGDRVGNYVIERRLGAGGQGEVFLARDVVLLRPAALKIGIQKAADADAKLRAVEEARLIAQLDHPNIVRIYHVDTIEGTWYTAMEYVDGGSIHLRVQRVGAFKPVDALRYGLAAAQALDHAHLLNVVHRDVKPQNLFLSRADVVKLADFGLAAVGEPPNIKVGYQVGTPAFMAPEVWLGQSCTPQSDIYSLGATLYYMLVGKPPFWADEADALRKLHLEQRPKLPRDLPKPVAQVILACLEKAPENRPRSAATVAGLMQQALNSLGWVPVPVTPKSDAPAGRPFLSDAARATADLGTLDTPPLNDISHELERGLAAGPPLIVIHNEDAQVRERVIRGVFERNQGRYYLGALILLRTPAPLLTSIAQRLRLENAASSPHYDAILNELSPPGSVPGVLQVSLHRRLTAVELGHFLELCLQAARTPSSKGGKFLISCDDDAAEHLRSELESGGYAELAQFIHVRKPTTREAINYILRWSEIATGNTVLWTPDALRFAVHPEGGGRASLDRTMQNAIAVGQASGGSIITTWCVLGGVAHPGHIRFVEGVDTKWRTRPTQWPSEEFLQTLTALRSDGAENEGSK